MKKAISNIFLTVMFAGLLSGCGAEEKEVSGSSDAVQEASGGAESQDVSGEQEVSESDGQELSVSTGGIVDPSAVLALSGKDNSLDVYSAAARAAKAIGYRKIITYTLDTEAGASIRAAGWTCMGQAGGKRWTGKRCPAVDLCPPQMKLRYEKLL